MGARHRRKGSLCSDGQNCIYAELLDIEERRAAELEEKAEDLEEKLARSAEELSSVKQTHAKFVSKVQRIAKKTKRHCKV